MRVDSVVLDVKAVPLDVLIFCRVVEVMMMMMIEGDYGCNFFRTTYTEKMVAVYN